MHVLTYVELYLYEETLRFTEPSQDAPAVPGEDDYIGIIPSLLSVNISPTVLAPGESVGQRESVEVTLKDHQHPFDGTDYATGTLWGKIRARYPSLRGVTLIVRRGEVGQHLGEMESRTYVMESMQYTGSDTVTLTAKDPLKQLDSDRAVAPEASPGRLNAGIAAGAGSLFLTPTGIGNDFYRTAGLGTIGGREIVSYTRSGNSVTLTARGLYNTADVDHEADESFQEVLEFNTGSGTEVAEADFNAVGLFVPAGQVWSGGQPAEIIAYLAVRYAGVAPDLIPLGYWYLESNRQYTAVIATPEGVKKLVDELLQQGGFVLWYDPVEALITLRSLLNSASSGTYNADRLMAGTYAVKDQPDKQVTQAWCYWGRQNPLKKLDDLDNYRAVQVSLAHVEYPTAFSEDDPQKIRTILGRWIDSQGNAEFVTRLFLARYSTAPRQFTFGVYRADPGTQPQLGRRALVRHWSLQDEAGEETEVPAQIIAIAPTWDQGTVTAEETFVSTAGLTDLIVYIDQNSYNVNLRDLYDAQFTPPDGASVVTFILVSGIRVGSTSTASPSMDVGAWPEAPTINLRIDGSLVGHGGNGGNQDTSPGGDGHDGGTALYTRMAINVENNGVLWGGGGGGGGSPTTGGGGGGGGWQPGECPGSPSRDGTFDSGGGGPLGGEGGGPPGSPGAAGPPDGGTTSPGASGNAVDGDSYVTYTVPGDIRGPQVN